MVCLRGFFCRYLARKRHRFTDVRQPRRRATECHRRPPGSRPQAGHKPARVLVLRAWTLDRFVGFLKLAPFAQQLHEVMQGTTVTSLSTVAQHRVHPPLVKRSVESPTRVDVRECEFGELVESLRTNEQIHVPQMIVMREEVGGVALGTSAHRRDGCIPVIDPFCRLYPLAPFHRTSIPQRFRAMAHRTLTRRRARARRPACVPCPPSVSGRSTPSRPGTKTCRPCGVHRTARPREPARHRAVRRRPGAGRRRPWRCDGLKRSHWTTAQAPSSAPPRKPVRSCEPVRNCATECPILSGEPVRSPPRFPWSRGS